MLVACRLAGLSAPGPHFAFIREECPSVKDAVMWRNPIPDRNQDLAHPSRTHAR